MAFSADAVQGVCFIEPSSRPDDALRMWSAVFPNGGPEGFQRVANSPTLLSFANGEQGGFFCSLNVQVGRIDIVLNRRNPQTLISVNEGPPRIENIKEAVDFLALHLQNATTHQKVMRIGIVLDLTMDSVLGAEAEAMRSQLAHLHIPQNATDVQFQMNVRKQLECQPNLAMNRLCAWSSGQAGFFQITPTGPVAGQLRPVITMKVDVNTAPEGRLASTSIPMAIKELAHEALRLHIKGLDGLWGDGNVK